MSIRVLRPGMLTTLQDLGRYGYQKYGVIVSGGMDSYSLRLANFLVGNEEGQAVLEITLTGPSLQVEKDLLLAITGGNLSPQIARQPVPMGRPVYVKAGSIIQFGACQSGCRSYLAVAGGFSVLEVMGSKSTYLRAELGGFQGRALQREDVLLINPPQESSLQIIRQLAGKSSPSSFVSTTWYTDSDPILINSRHIRVRVLRGRQFDQFSAASQEQLFHSAFRVTTQSDRMGYRLSGVKLQLAQPLEMVSEAVGLGTIQVPPDGNPIILLADRQTAGGYPKIAQVAAVDVAVVAQSKPGSEIWFEEISLAEAEELYLAREQAMNQLKAAIRLKFL